jgi:hypothetical protein
LSKLNGGQRSIAEQVYDSYHGGAGAQAKALKVTVPAKMLQDTMISTYGVDKKLQLKDWKPQYRQIYNNLNGNIEREIEYYETVHQKEPDGPTIQGMIDGQLKSQYTEEHWFGNKTKPMADLKVGILNKGLIDSIQAKFPDLSDEQHYRLYQAKINGDRELFNSIAKGD